MEATDHRTARPGAIPALAAALALTVALAPALAGCPRHTLRAADPAKGVVLPRDHGAHDDAQTEWWHFHGHLQDDAGRKVDWFLAFIRQHTDHDRIAGLPLRLFVNPFQIAFFALTDRAAGRFHVRDKYAYPDVWTAGARRDALALRHDSWRARTGEGAVVHLHASARRAELAVRMRAAKPAALMGKAGYLHVPPRSSHYYYSIPRLDVEGTVTIGGEARAVKGTGWLKHEWGYLYTDLLDGWVWFGIQLRDGSDLVIAMIFDRDWKMAEGSFAAVVDPLGGVHPLNLREMEVKESGETWRSPRTGTVYPVGWRIEIPERKARLDLRAVLPGQELVVMPANMWAGALTVEGWFDAAEARGDCFAEIVGLQKPFGRRLFRSGRPD